MTRTALRRCVSARVRYYRTPKKMGSELECALGLEKDWYKAAAGKNAFKVKSLKAPKTVFQAYYT